MEVAIVTGSQGLIGAETVKFLSSQGFKVVGIDNDMRKVFFGDDASTLWQRQYLQDNCKHYTHYTADIRNNNEIEKIFKEYSSDIKLVVHTAAQPSHDWAAREPFTDFTVNANGTLVMLETLRQYSPGAVFIFTSTNKVYGDSPNHLPLEELETRFEPAEECKYYKKGIDESMSIDQTKHSLFGASKVAADVLVQEYGRYFGIKTGIFRGGCLTGPGHSGTELHGFLSYLMKCAITGNEYKIFGYKGKQVRDNIHSHDLVSMFWHFYKNPGTAKVYNAGGSRHSNCSMQEAITICEDITGKKMNTRYIEESRIGDHIWWISDVSSFQKDYPEWHYTYDLKKIMNEIYSGFCNRI